MKKKTLLLFYMCCSFSIVLAQSIKFKESIGGVTPDYGYGAKQTYDNGYIAVGSTASFSYGETDVYVVRTDSNGFVLWPQRHFGTPFVDVGRSVEETKDSSLIITGFTNGNLANGYDVLLLRLDKWGDSLWWKTYGGTGWDFAYSVHQTFDRGFIIAGGTYSYGVGGEDFWLIKTDANGDTMWTKTYGGTKDDEARSVRQTSDSGYILVGTTKSFGDTTGDIYVVKTKANGDTLWTKKYGGSKEDDGTDIVTCKNGGYALCGRSYSFPVKGSKMYLIRIKSNGDTLYSNIANYVYPKDTVYESLEGIVELPNGYFSSIGVYFGQYSASGNGNGYMYVTDSVFNWKAGNTYGTIGGEGCYSLSVTKDKGYIICGFTDSTSLGFAEANLFLIKTDSVGVDPHSPFLLSTKNLSSTLNFISAYPNPFNSVLNITLNTNSSLNPIDFRISIVDIRGQSRIPSYRIISASNQDIALQINKNNLNPGIYFIQYYSGQQMIGISKIAVE